MSSSVDGSPVRNAVGYCVCLSSCSGPCVFVLFFCVLFSSFYRTVLVDIRWLPVFCFLYGICSYIRENEWKAGTPAAHRCDRLCDTWLCCLVPVFLSLCLAAGHPLQKGELPGGTGDSQEGCASVRNEPRPGEANATSFLNVCGSGSRRTIYMLCNKS